MCEFISFSHLGFWSRNLFMIAVFPNHCLHDLFVHFCVRSITLSKQKSENTKEDKEQK